MSNRDQKGRNWTLSRTDGQTETQAHLLSCAFAAKKKVLWFLEINVACGAMFWASIGAPEDRILVKPMVVYMIWFKSTL